MSQPSLTVTSDFTKQFGELISRYKSDEVLVGIPEDAEARDDDSPISSAGILALNHFGSESANIPPRPVLPQGIRNAQDAIAEQFKICAQQSLKKGLAAIPIYYERAGIIAANSCKKVITDQEGIEGPSESTLATREARGFKGTKALLVTGQTRNAITHVVKTKWGR